MPVLRCPTEGCEWEYTSELGDAQCLEIIKLHFCACSKALPVPASTPSKAPKINRPMVDVGIDQEEWDLFVIRWKQFRIGSNISDNCASLQLFQCATEGLGRLLLQSDQFIAEGTENDLLAAMESLSVIKVSKGARRAELMKLTQGADESIRTFAAKVQGKAQTCGFVTRGKCKCGEIIDINYTPEVIKDVIMAGISDIEIQTSILEMEDLESKPLNELIGAVERKERARKAYRPIDVAVISGYKKSKNRGSMTYDKHPPPRSKKIPCPDCKRLFRAFNGKNSSPFRNCFNCKKSLSQKKQTAAISGSEKGVAAVINSGHNVDEDEILSQTNYVMGNSLEFYTNASNQRGHPRVKIQIKPLVDGAAAVSIAAIADTGAQTNLWGFDDFSKAGYGTVRLQKPSVKLFAANKQAIDVVGGLEVELSGQTPLGDMVSCKAMVYISKSVSGFFLSYGALMDLFILDENFPIVGSCLPTAQDPSPPNLHGNPVSFSVRAINLGCLMENGEDEPCGCPQRSNVPPKPSSLPFPPVPGNIKKMKEWLLKRYASSTFNICPHRPLQQMAGPPVEIHVDKSAKPRDCKKAASIPVHWQQQVRDDIKRDEALGILERVPYGVLTEWCHRMVVTRKHNGKPRRTVDLSPLNRYCKRETFPSESPFHLARRVPSNTWKTCSDAWNGYHSVPLRKSDHHLTTFITPFGKWRYTRTPQGYLSSGDCYNRRFDAILSDFQNKERCIDDTVHFDYDIAKHWWRTIEFLSIVGSSGVVLNPDKFQFCQRTVDFAGFRISEGGIEPLPKYTDAIKYFPTPTNRTDIKSWFGLVNQVGNYNQLRDIMAPFRPLLKAKSEFVWTDDLDKAFSQSREAIVKLIEKGVRIFDLSRRTCLRPDWSKRGIGYFLMQKHCACPKVIPDCCPTGWEVTLAGSRFLSDAEARYAAVEGEALAIAWGLEQTRYFTLGCKDLLVVTDHKPLLKIFSDRTLDEIPNPRLFRLKQRTLPWSFNIEYLPGKTNKAADATSRYPIADLQLNSVSIHDIHEQMIAENICSVAVKVTAVSWKDIVRETMLDPVLSQLLKAVEEGFRGNYTGCNSYLRYKDSLYVQEGAIMLNDRVIIPQSLRNDVLKTLHAAHQGVSKMLLRAHEIIYWPGMSDDIRRTRAQCSDCNRNAPSQPAMPAKDATIPLTPFEQIFADFFSFSGHHYLIVGDRLSGWTEIFSTPTGTTAAGARGLIKCLRRMFSIFGVPVVLSSDGGPEFAAEATKEFLQNWDVEHRMSSAYNPRSNGRAEVAVKTAKRLLRSNVNLGGSLNSDAFLRAMFTLRNTPDTDCRISPAEILFGHPLRDALSFSSKLRKFSYQHISNRWRGAWKMKESALRTRYVRNSENMDKTCRVLPPLHIGDRCFLQNRHGNYPRRWDRTGTIMDVKPYDKYCVRIDGSRKLTTRNRRFLKLFHPISTSVEPPPPHPFYDNSGGDGGNDVEDEPVSSVPAIPDDFSLDPSDVTPEVPMASDRTSSDVGPSGTCDRERELELVGPTCGRRENAEPTAVTPAFQPSPKMGDPLCVRRLREHNEHGVKQFMKNSAGRRSFQPSPKKGDPLCVRRLREHNEHGVKQFMKNPAGRRSAGGTR